MMTLEKYINHAIGREYMSGVERDRQRVKATGEVFTPDSLVQEMLEQLGTTQPGFWDDINKTVLDPSCGDGQFLVWVVLYKMVSGDMTLLDDDIAYTELDVTDLFEAALKTVYGVELMPDNAEECRRRLLCGHEEFRHIVEKHIVCANALEYDYSFGETTS